MFNLLKLTTKLGSRVIKDKGIVALSTVQRRYFSICIPKMADNKKKQKVWPEGRIVWVDLEV